MDQGSLVTEQIKAGAEFVERLDKQLHVNAAFWLKIADQRRWYLYIASDQVDYNQSMKPAYAEIAQAARALNNPNLDVFQIRVLALSDPIAQAALDVHKRFTARVPLHTRDRIFGDVYADEVYVYPPPPAGDEAEKWRGLEVNVWPESKPEGAYRVEFWPLELAAMVPFGGTRRIPRPAGVLVQGGQAASYTPPERDLPHLTQSDYEKKAVEAVEQVAATSK